MKLSKLIENLQTIKDKNKDCEVYIYNKQTGYSSVTKTNFLFPEYTETSVYDHDDFVLDFDDKEMIACLGPKPELKQCNVCMRKFIPQQMVMEGSTCHMCESDIKRHWYLKRQPKIKRVDVINKLNSLPHPQRKDVRDDETRWMVFDYMDQKYSKYDGWVRPKNLDNLNNFKKSKDGEIVGIFWNKEKEKWE